MPLRKGKSDKAAVAIAMKQAGRARKKGKR